MCEWLFHNDDEPGIVEGFDARAATITLHEDKIEPLFRKMLSKKGNLLN